MTMARPTTLRRDRGLLRITTLALALVIPASAAVAAPAPASAASHAVHQGFLPHVSGGPGASAWIEQSLPSGVGELRSVACPGPSECLAAGETTSGEGIVVETTNGGDTWSTVTPSSGVDQLWAISCVSPVVCVAGGGSGPTAQMFEQVGVGQTFTPVTLPSGTGFISELSCAAGTTYCSAIGNGSGFAGDVFVSDAGVGTSSGDSWAGQVVIPAFGPYFGLDCLAAEVCFAAGNYSTDDYTTLVYTDDGWAQYSDTIGPSSQVTPASLSCVVNAAGATDCTMAGSAGVAFVAQSAAGSSSWGWNVAATPGGGPARAAFCVNPSTCAAASRLASGGAVYDIYSTTDAGSAATSWTDETSQLAGIGISDIACSPGSLCVAAGYGTSENVGVVLTDGGDPLTNAAGPPGGAVPELTMAGGQCGCVTGDPVNVATGDYYQSTTDVSVKTYGPGLSFARTYDADVAQAEAGATSPAPGPLGWGWTYNSFQHLEVADTADPAAGQVTLVDGSGAETIFDPPTTSPAGCPHAYETDPSPTFAPDSYCSVSYNESVLTYVPAAGSVAAYFTLVTHPSEIAQFDASGQLTSITQGTSLTAGLPTLTVTYDSPAPGVARCPKTAASCELVASASGRSITIAWSKGGDGGLVESVTDPAGRVTAYGYCSSASPGYGTTCTTGDLISVTDPAGRVTSYTYDTTDTVVADRHDLLTVTDPNAQAGGPDAGKSLVNVYTSGRVVSQTDPAGATTTWNYAGMDFSSGNGSVVVTDPDGVVTTYTFSGNVETGQTTSHGGVQSSAETVGRDWSSLQPLVTTNGDGDPSYVTYAPDGNVASTTNSDGGTSSVWYNPDDEPICTSDPEAAVPAGAPVPGNVCESLDEMGDLPGAGTVPAEGSGVPLATGWATPEAGVTFYLYDADGNLLFSEQGVWSGSTLTGSRVSYMLYKGDSITIGSDTVKCAAQPSSVVLPCAEIAPDNWLAAANPQPAPRVTQIAYDSHGDLTTKIVVDATGKSSAKTTYNYDADGELTAQASPLGNLRGADKALYTTHFAYNADGEKVSTTTGLPGSALGSFTSSSYDANGLVVSSSNALFESTSTSYDPDGRAILVRDADGATLTCYDADGNVVETVPPVGVAANSLGATSCPATPSLGTFAKSLASDATLTSYDVLSTGRVVTTEAPAPPGLSGNETSTAYYDPAGRLVLTISPPVGVPAGDDVATVYTYDDNGNLVATTDGLAFDPSTAAISTTASTSTSSTCYDQAGQATAAIPGDGNSAATVSSTGEVSGFICQPGSSDVTSPFATTYTYDSVGDRTSATVEVSATYSRTITTGYNPDGSVASVLSPGVGSGAVTTTDSYTPAGQLSAQTYSDTETPLSIVYNVDGARVSMSDASGKSTYIYDPAGELASARDGDAMTVAYGYDLAGRDTAVTYPLGVSAIWAKTPVVEYSYDGAGRLVAIGDFSGSTIAITSTADGLPANVSLPTTTPVTISTCYGNSDVPSQTSLEPTADAGTGTGCPASSGWLAGFAYSDAPTGQLAAESDSPSGCSPSYGYSASGQVLADSPTTSSCAAESYSYDASGNLTELPASPAGPASLATYNFAGELCWSAPDATAGSTCQTTAPSDATSYSYAPDGALAGSTGPTAASDLTAQYDGKGQLVQAENTSATMSAAIYDGNGLRTSDTVGGSAQQFTWDAVSPLPHLLLDGSAAFIYGTGNAPLCQVALSTGAASYLLTDALGSVRAVVSSTGAVVAETSYDAWGNPSTAGGLTSYTPFGFAGGYTDPTGFVYLDARYYDPGIGQFLSIDPLVGQTGQPYLYAGGDPVNRSDPSGRCQSLTLQQLAQEQAGLQLAASFLGTLSVLAFFTGLEIVDIGIAPIEFGFEAAMLSAEDTAVVAPAADSVTGAEGGSAGRSEAFHYTGSQNLASIEAIGLRAGAYATPDGELSPLQAQIDLALPPNRDLPGGLIRIDLAGLRQAGYDIPDVTQVGRSYNMPGGGYEMQFPYPIPPEFLKVVRP